MFRDGSGKSTARCKLTAVGAGERSVEIDGEAINGRRL
jgi:hypothetical protein